MFSIFFFLFDFFWFKINVVNFEIKVKNKINQGIKTKKNINVKKIKFIVFKNLCQFISF
jgi:hypothetical protein